MKTDKNILLAAQKTAGQDHPEEKDLYRVGTIGTVLQLLKLPDGTVKVLVEGGKRARIENFIENTEFFEATAATLEEPEGHPSELEALMRSTVSQFEN